MTDEERQKLVTAVREVALMWGSGSEPRIITENAADEIEQLEKELANANRLLEINRRRSLEKSGGLEIKQSDAEPSLSDQMYGFHGAGFNSTTSDAEPVAWRWRLKGDPDWCFWEDAGPWPDDVEVEPLYTVPPRPDTSAEIERLTKQVQAAHGYADECTARIRMLNDQIDSMIAAKDREHRGDDD
jgi:hypothetical protein